MIRFLHAADLHLDSPLRGLEKYEGAPAERIRGASRHALINLVDLAIAEGVSFVILAGDIYDGDWTDVGTGLFFVGQMSRLRDAKIPVFLLAGNHDAANKMSRKLPYPDNVRIFAHASPTTFTLDDLGVALHGQGFAEQAEPNNLALGYPAAYKKMFNIGVLHTALTGREGHERYAPCMVEDLLTRNYDYWALGHVHQRESVRAGEQPCVEFPGNIQGRNIREIDAKGCLLATVNDRGHVSTEFRPLDVVRWHRIRVNCEGVTHRDDVFRLVASGFEEAVAEADGRMLAARVELFGPCPHHDAMLAQSVELRDEIRAVARTFGEDATWVEKVQVHTSRPEDDSPDAFIGDDALSEIAAVSADLFASPEKLQALLDLDDLKALASKIPAELQEGDAPLRLDDPDWVKHLLDRARTLLTAAATPKEAGR